MAFVGRDGPREFAVTAAEAQTALKVFLAVDKLIAAPASAAWDVLVDLDAVAEMGPDGQRGPA